MAFETTPFGAIAAPGLAFPFVTHSIETGILQEDKDSEGGFALWAKKGVAGEAGKVYVNQPAGSEAEPVMTTASTGTVSVKVDGETVATASVTSESTVATLLTALASAWNSDSDYTAEASETKLTITAKTAGAEANADVFSAERGSKCRRVQRRLQRRLRLWWRRKPGHGWRLRRSRWRVHRHRPKDDVQRLLQGRNDSQCAQEGAHLGSRSRRGRFRGCCLRQQHKQRFHGHVHGRYANRGRNLQERRCRRRTR